MTKHIYHFNMHSEKKYFLGKEHINNYDLIGLNGNIVAHSPNAIAALISTTAKKYFIDPQTHIFQHDPHLLESNSRKPGEEDQIKYKTSVVKLAERHLGMPFYNVLQTNSRLSPESFKTESGDLENDLISESCDRVLDFQKSFIGNNLDEEERDLLGKDLPHPDFLIAPYFYISRSNTKEWLEINEAFYKAAKISQPNEQVFYALVVSKDAMDSFQDRIIESLKGLNLDGILLWIDGHQEEDLTSSQVECYIKLLKNLKSLGAPIYNSHAGYLSILLSHPALNLLQGLGHSMNYGEHRTVVPVGGGIPQAYFYLRKNHSRNKYVNAFNILSGKGWYGSVEEYLKNVCNCHKCQELIRLKGSAIEAFISYGETGEPTTIRRRNGTVVRISYPTGEAKDIAVRHYVNNKDLEFNSLNTKSFSELNDELKDVYNDLLKVADIKVIQHLDIWNASLTKLAEGR